MPNVTSGYHPQTKRLSERLNRTLIDCLRKVTDEEDDWDRKISAARFVYRTSKHTSIGMTPFKIVYGREARLPIDVAMKVNSGDDVTSGDNDTSDLNAEVERMVSILKSVHAKAAENIKVAQAEQTRKYNQRHTPPTFEVRFLVISVLT